MRPRIATIAMLVLLLGVGAQPARAALSAEQQQGRTLMSQLRSGAKVCDALSAADFDHVGEYVMGSVLGSAAAHEAMDARMASVLGDAGAQRMHELVGRRATGCADGTAASMMGAGTMMGSAVDWGAMRRAGAWHWMADGSWRMMSSRDWQQLERQLGPAHPRPQSQDHGWSTPAIVAFALGMALLLGVIIVAVLRHPWRRPPAAA